MTNVGPAVTPAGEAGAWRSAFAWAVWMGLAAGIGEAALFLLLRSLALLTWKTRFPHSSAELFAVAPLVNVGLLLLAAGGCWVLARAVRTMRALFVVTASLTFLLSDWLFVALGGRLAFYSILILALAGAVAGGGRIAWLTPALATVRRRTFVPLLMLAVVCGGGTLASSRIAETRATWSLPDASAAAPNVIVVIFDTLRADRLSAYGYTRPTSPHLDALAARGVLFEHAIAPSSWSLPSHASLLTGMMPREHGANTPFGPGRVLAEGVPTISGLLRQKGYRTAGFSANRMFFTRTEGFDRSFDRFEDYYDSATDALGRTYVGRQLQDIFVRHLPVRYSLEPLKRADDVNGEVTRWLDRDLSHPFLMFINYFDVHGPELAPAPFAQRFVSGYAVPTDRDSLPRGKQPDAQTLRYVSDTYDGSIAYADDRFAGLLAHLEQSGKASNTILIVTADHGEMMGEHGYVDHGVALNGGEIHVPLIVVWPGHLPEGRRIARPVSSASIAATIADLAGVTEPVPFTQPSLTPLWTRSDAEAEWPWPRSEIGDTGSGRMDGRWTYTVLSPEFQLVEDDKTGLAVYRTADDPQGLKDISASPEAQAALPELKARLKGAAR